MKFWQRLKKNYKDKSWRRRHPASSFLIETLAIVVILWLSFYIPKFLENRPNLDHLTRADFNIEELGLVDQIVENIDRWRRYYFLSSEESADDSGDLSFLKLAFIVPILLILFFVLTPILLVLYMGWFIYHYIFDLFMIGWGLIYYLGFYIYRYIIYLVGQISVLGRRLGKILPMDTSPLPFGDTMGRWRQTYIDPVILRERIAYLEAIQSFISRNVKPYWNQAMSPYMRFKAEWEFFWGIFFTRTGKILEYTTDTWENNVSETVKLKKHKLKTQYNKLPKDVRQRFQKGAVATTRTKINKELNQSSLARLITLFISLSIFVLSILKFKSKSSWISNSKWRFLFLNNVSAPLSLLISFSIFSLSYLV